MTSNSNLLVGRRAVYTQVESKWDEARKEYVEVSRKAIRGTIAALIVKSSDNYPAVVMLWDDGTLSAHSIGDITLEGETGGPYR